MDKTQKAILTVTSIILSILLLIIFGKILKFERFKDNDNEVETIDREIVDKLYSYLPSNGDYNYDTMYNGSYSSFNSISSNTIEKMIINYLSMFEHDKCETYNISEIISIITDDQPSALYKISAENIDYALKKVFGDKHNFIIKNADLDYQTKALYYNNYLYVYNIVPNQVSNYKIYRGLVRYSIDKEGTILIYDYYLKCDKTTKICYNDERLKDKSSIIYSDNLNINDYSNDLKLYEHQFRIVDGSYYWDSSKQK